jgi:hypothetical protein
MATPQRTSAAEIARFTWITPATFGERLGGEKPVSAVQVRRLIKRGLIRPEMVMPTNPGSRRPDYRIDPAAVEAFRKDHAGPSRQEEKAA